MRGRWQTSSVGRTKRSSSGMHSLDNVARRPQFRLLGLEQRMRPGLVVAQLALQPLALLLQVRPCKESLLRHHGSASISSCARGKAQGLPLRPPTTNCDLAPGGVTRLALARPHGEGASWFFRVHAPEPQGHAVQQLPPPAAGPRQLQLLSHDSQRLQAPLPASPSAACRVNDLSAT